MMIKMLYILLIILEKLFLQYLHLVLSQATRDAPNSIIFFLFLILNMSRHLLDSNKHTNKQKSAGRRDGLAVEGGEAGHRGDGEDCPNKRRGQRINRIMF